MFARLDRSYSYNWVIELFDMFVLTYLLCSLLMSYADTKQYDQRQTGDVNVQVDLKDLHFFAVLKSDKEEYVDYDYAYDYSELTIKPQNRTTPNPLNNTSSSTEKIDTGDNTTVTTILLQENTVPNIKINESTTTESAGFTMATIIGNEDDTIVKKTFDVTTKSFINSLPNVTGDAAPVHASTRKPCRKGYVLNKKGQCQLKMNNTENTLLRLVKLSQKLKSRRENKSNE